MTEHVDTHEPQHLVVGSLPRFIAVVLAFCVLGGALAALYAGSQATTYSSSSRILLRPLTGNPYSSETESNSQQTTTAMTTEATLVNSEPVIDRVNARVAPNLSSDDISATVPPNTSTILIKARASSATTSQEWAQGVAKGYLSYREHVASKARQASLAKVGVQISAVKASLAKASDAAEIRGPDSQAARESQALTEQLISLQDLANAARTTDTDGGTLVTSASRGTASGISPGLMTVAGAIIGLLIGVAVALVIGLRDKRVHGRAETTVGGLPVLATLRGRRGRNPEADQQTYQRLRTSVLALAAVPSAVAVSGVSPKDTSASIAWELGRSIARAGYRVVLVVAGAQEVLTFGDDRDSVDGLAQALRGGRDAVGLLVNHDGVAVLSAGSGILEAQELLSGEAFGRMVSELKSTFDYVLIATGSAVLPIELATARHADILLLVGRDRVSSRVTVSEVAERARLVGVLPAGLILRSWRWREEPPTPRRQARPETTHADTSHTQSQAVDRHPKLPTEAEPR